jgi:hypothetical protein
MPMSISVSIRLTAIQVSSMNPIGTRASPVFARANWGTKVHYKVATLGVSSTFLTNETALAVCAGLIKYYQFSKERYITSGKVRSRAQASPWGFEPPLPP